MSLGDRPLDRRRGSKDFWTARKVAWYQRANARSDYGARFLDAAAPLLAECRTAADVGAGSGALALPLARRLEVVTAVEPSPRMAAALRDAATRAALANLRVIEAEWRPGLVGPHDLLLCAHVSHLMGPGSAFLAEASTIARRWVVLVRDTPGGEDKFFFGELYPILLGRPYGKRCERTETIEELRRLGIEPKTAEVQYSSDQPFDTLDEACDFWMEYMGLEDPRSRAFLEEFLAARLRRDGHEWIAPFRKRVTVIYWSTGRSKEAH